MFKKLVYICLWLCVLSGTASTASSPVPARTPASVSAATLAP